MIDKTIIRHFGSPSAQLELGGGFVPHGYPCFTLSATSYLVMLLRLPGRALPQLSV